MECIHRIVLITGTRYGFGFTTAQRLASKGYRIVCCDKHFLHRSPDSTIVEAIHGKGNILFCGMDAMSSNSIRNVIDTTKAAFGEGPSVVVNAEQYCSGEELINRAMEPHTLESFQEIMDRNVVGLFNVIRHVAKEMINNPVNSEGERGVFINTSGLTSTNGSGEQVAYSAAMAAISGLSLPVARALGRHGIRCVDIQPGLFDVPNMKDYEDTINLLCRMAPFPKRLGLPDEFANLVESIIDNPMLNGCSIRLDGGLRC